mgnify:FL=1
MPQDEFLGLVQACDVFDLVFLDKDFPAGVKEKLSAHPLLDDSILSRLKDGVSYEDIKSYV